MIIFERNKLHALAAFKTPAAAGKYLTKNIQNLNQTKVVVLAGKGPVYVFENRDVSGQMQFFTDKNEVIQEIKSFNARNKQFNLLISIINKDWYPELHGGKAGDNLMGYLNHVHIAKCGSCGLLAPGLDLFNSAFTKEETKAFCDCDKATW